MFFYNILGFIQSYSGPLGDIDGFVHIFPSTYKSDKPNNIIGVDKLQLKSDCVSGSIVDGVREPISYCFALEKPPRQKI